MKKILLIIIFCLLSFLTHASEVVSSAKTYAYFETEYIDGIGKVAIKTSVDNELLVRHDKNTCEHLIDDDPRMVCSIVGYNFNKVTPVRIEDTRAVDGPLVLQLNHELKLAVAHNMLGESHYTIIAQVNDKEIKMPMKSLHKIRFSF